MATNQPVSRDDPDYAQSGYDPAKIEAARAADTRNVQSVIESLRAADTRYVQPGRDWFTRNVQPVLHQLSQMPPESPDTVKARLLAQTTRAMYPAQVNADMRTPDQNAAILQRIHGDKPAPASTGQAVTAIPGTATPGDGYFGDGYAGGSRPGGCRSGFSTIFADLQWSAAHIRPASQRRPGSAPVDVIPFVDRSEYVPAVQPHAVGRRCARRRRTYCARPSSRHCARRRRTYCGRRRST